MPKGKRFGVVEKTVDVIYASRKLHFQQGREGTGGEICLVGCRRNLSYTRLLARKHFVTGIQDPWIKVG